MSRKPVLTKTLIDPRFKIPIGAEGNFVFSRMPGPGDDGGGYAVPLRGVPVELVSEFVLDTPDVILVVNQTLRRAPGGQQLVDVVIDVEDVPGAIEFEIQIAKKV